MPPKQETHGGLLLSMLIFQILIFAFRLSVKAVESAMHQDSSEMQVMLHP